MILNDMFDLKAVNSFTTEKEKQQELINYYEKKYDDRIMLLASTIEKEKKKIVLLTGPSSSGKTTTALKLQHSLTALGLNSVMISLDNFFKNKEEMAKDKNGNYEFEKVEALEIDLVNQKLAELANGKKTRLPVFDFHSGTRKDDAREVELNDGVAIIEGIHAHNDILLKGISHNSFLKLYISVHSGFEFEGKVILPKRDVRFCRRLIRDYYFRNSSAEHTCNLWLKVIEDEVKYVLPYSRTADVRIDTAFPYELGLYKERIINILNEVASDSIWQDKARYIKEILDYFGEFDKENLPKTSLITEFSGGGSFKYE